MDENQFIEGVQVFDSHFIDHTLGCTCIIFYNNAVDIASYIAIYVCKKDYSALVLAISVGTSGLHDQCPIKLLTACIM